MDILTAARIATTSHLRGEPPSRRALSSTNTSTHCSTCNICSSLSRSACLILPLACLLAQRNLFLYHYLTAYLAYLLYVTCRKDLWHSYTNISECYLTMCLVLITTNQIIFVSQRIPYGSAKLWNGILLYCCTKFPCYGILRTTAFCHLSLRMTQLPRIAIMSLILSVYFHTKHLHMSYICEIWG